MNRTLHDEGPCRIAIIGGGASGIACAISVLRRIESDLDISVFEPRERLGEGIAYGTHDAEHLLNVRAANMSVHADIPDSFREWADAGSASYQPRRDYATYLRDELRSAEAARGFTVNQVRDVVTRIERTSTGFVVHDSAGVALLADVVILATGNEAPSLPVSIESAVGAEGFVHTNPWAEDVDRSGRTLVIGSGLTAVDICLSTLSRDPKSSVRLLSRHGLLPAVHEFPWRPPFPTPLFTAEDFRRGMSLGAAIRAIRDAGDEWRSAMDSIRPVTQEIWRTLTQQQREQFLRHVVRYWDVHRHRMAPIVGRMIAEWQAQGRLEIVAGEVLSIEPAGAGVLVRDSLERCWAADHVVVATGPESSCERNSLLGLLKAGGLVTPGPSGIGIAMEPASHRVIAASGSVHAGMYVIGSPTKGVLFESTAMPDIRNSAATIADAIRDDLLGRVEPGTLVAETA